MAVREIAVIRLQPWDILRQIILIWLSGFQTRDTRTADSDFRSFEILKTTVEEEIASNHKGMKSIR
jgi:hypothetical protein